ncbi:MAG TPA: class I SAM-dependent methyltransferase, partial [Turneriella sp.]|nr:class I SAM-dependent methyltransferase [Turneriella sp.]
AFRPTICADAVTLPLERESLCALVAMNASIHYLCSTEELLQHFNECARVLDTQGVYIFDVCPVERACALSGRTQYALSGSVKFAHEFKSPFLTTWVFLKNEGKEIVEEHRQRIFSVDEILTAIQSSAFLLEGFEENYGLLPQNNAAPFMAYVLHKV